MGLLDRILGSRTPSVKVDGTSAQPKAKKEEPEAFYLDADSSSSLGDVNFMRRSNKIRRTFPGNADSPGEKEMVQEVDSMDAKLEVMTPGLAGMKPSTGGDVNLSSGVPKPVKKTFVQQISPAEMEQRLKGSAISGVNAPAGSAPAKKKAASSADQPVISPQPAKPGDIDPFKAMANELNK